jgi:hypothetical protein
MALETRAECDDQTGLNDFEKFNDHWPTPFRQKRSITSEVGFGFRPLEDNIAAKNLVWWHSQ